MTRTAFAPVLASLLLAGCSGNVCDYIGDYSGTFDGDASGAVTLTVTDGTEEGHALAAITLEGDEFSAVGNGEVHCDDGELVVTLYDDAGNEIGSFTGSMLAEAASGEWELGTGESGTWQLAAD